jgi:hypothetical protein
VTSERTRTQAGNIADCFAKLHTYILAASAVPTAPSAAARARITTLCVLMRRCGQPAVSLTFGGGGGGRNRERKAEGLRRHAKDHRSGAKRARRSHDDDD